MDYIRGLISTRGRKSIRNMAALMGGSGTGQSLHHFICSSTWDWTPVRRAMAAHLLETAPPQAWVARPMIIPKVGQHSVGVGGFSFSRTEGQALNAQRAIGVWAVSDRMSAPLNWRLHLPQTWIKDGLRRNQASIPCEVEPETLSDCVLTACREMLTDWKVPARPVVVDIAEADPVATAGGLRAAGIPSVVRVPDELPLTVTDPALTGHGAHKLPVAEIMRAAGNMRRPVLWREPGPHPRRRTSLITAVRVRLPGVRPGPERREGDFLLVGVGESEPAPPLGGVAHRHPQGAQRRRAPPEQLLPPRRPGLRRDHLAGRHPRLRGPLLQRLAPSRHPRLGRPHRRRHDGCGRQTTASRFLRPRGGRRDGRAGWRATDPLCPRAAHAEMHGTPREAAGRPVSPASPGRTAEQDSTTHSAAGVCCSFGRGGVSGQRSAGYPVQNGSSAARLGR